MSAVQIAAIIKFKLKLDSIVSRTKELDFCGEVSKTQNELNLIIIQYYEFNLKLL